MVHESFNEKDFFRSNIVPELMNDLKGLLLGKRAKWVLVDNVEHCLNDLVHLDWGESLLSLFGFSE